MKTLKGIVSIALVLLLLGATPVFAEEQFASFEVEQNSSETADLKETVQLLRSELGEMKSGMQQLQGQMVESEIVRLQQQLQSLRSGSSVPTNNLQPAPQSDYNFTPAPTEDETPIVTSIEDLLGIDLEEAGIEVETTETEPAEELTELEAKDVEIAKLKAVLAEKDNQEAHAETVAKNAAVELTEEELAKVEIADVIQSLTAEEAAEQGKTANIIAKADGEILFQFPRSVSQKIAPKQNPSQLTASVLNAEFERESKGGSFSFFTIRNISILIGVLVIAVAVFVVWLMRHERELLAATSRRFRQLEFKPNTDLSSRLKKMTPFANKENKDENPQQ